MSDYLKFHHDPLCPNLPCTCEPDDYGHMWTCEKLCQCDIIRAAYQRGHKEAEEFKIGVDNERS